MFPHFDRFIGISEATEVVEELPPGYTAGIHRLSYRIQQENPGIYGGEEVADGR